MTYDELLQHAKHLEYEIAMFVEIPLLLREGIENVVIRNSILESFGVYARNLADFLEKQPPDGRAVHASHFFTDRSGWERIGRCNQEWKDLRGELESLVCGRVDKEIVHLTRNRINVIGRKKDWDIDIVLSLLVPRLRRFAENADRLANDARMAILDWLHQSDTVTVVGRVVFSTASPPTLASGVLSTSMPIKSIDTKAL